MSIWIERAKTVFAYSGPFAFLIGLYFYWQKKKELAAHARYTIAQVTGTDYVLGPSPHDVLFFTYTVNDSTYATNSPDVVREGKQRYVVKFSALNPAINRLYILAPVPDSVQRVPPQGWLTPPFPVPEDMLTEW